MNPAGVLHAACLRSPHAHARLGADRRVPRARALPGVHLVLTAADLGELNQPGPLLIPHPALTHPRTQRPLAVDEVRYVGETVAFVVADDRYVAEDAVGLIEVDYEPLPVVTDVRARRSPPERRVVHGDVPATAPPASAQRVGDPERRLRAGRPRLPRAAHYRAELREPHRGRAASWPSTIRAAAS